MDKKNNYEKKYMKIEENEIFNSNNSKDMIAYRRDKLDGTFFFV